MRIPGIDTYSEKFLIAILVHEGRIRVDQDGRWWKPWTQLCLPGVQ